MGGVISRCRRERASTNVTSQIVQLKGQRDVLEEHRASLAHRLAELEETTRNHVRTGERDKALMCLRKKALINDQLSKVDTYLYQVLQVISDTEMAQVNFDVYKHLKIGTELVAKISQDMKLNDIEELMELKQRCNDDMVEAGQILAQGLADVDESELLRELDTLCGAAASPAPEAVALTPTDVREATKEDAQSSSEPAHTLTTNLPEKLPDAPRAEPAQKVAIPS
ncbi:SNF7-RELATED, putative [Babesia bigemina]|uniref:SNF7-RELATED, putative n=1 Tax=Babesia bigemina TaxID=5866 RepID=A0A061D8I0_BABBI|nr:SNF7-RELATED, putative [Babesia bigemina]CDR96277.1 SNF7-RELATED, putative [Babesia bigemina]|eukprot:XP_012768463.1 SNF7-RELATED, putative [Babesia bigemina]